MAQMPPLRRRPIGDMTVLNLSPGTHPYRVYAVAKVSSVHRIGSILGRFTPISFTWPRFRGQISAGDLGQNYSGGNTGPGVDPVWWTPIHLRRRCHQCRRVTDLMRRNSGDRWLIWSARGELPRRCSASSNRSPRRSGIGCDGPIAMKGADRTARPAPSARS